MPRTKITLEVYLEDSGAAAAEVKAKILDLANELISIGPQNGVLVHYDSRPVME